MRMPMPMRSRPSGLNTGFWDEPVIRRRRDRPSFSMPRFSMSNRPEQHIEHQAEDAAEELADAEAPSC